MRDEGALVHGFHQLGFRLNLVHLGDAVDFAVAAFPGDRGLLWSHMMEVSSTWDARRPRACLLGRGRC